jgi:hypothetical protein
VTTISKQLTDTTGKPVYFAGDARTVDGAGTDLGYMTIAVAGDYAWSPDHPDLDLSTGVEMIVRSRVLDYTPDAERYPIGKYLSTGNQRSYLLGVSVDGRLRFYRSADGATIQSMASSTHAFTDGVTRWLRVVHDTGDGSILHSYADDQANEPTAWVANGGGTTGATTPIYNGTAILQIGSVGTPGNPAVDRMHRAIVRDVPNGTPVFDADFTASAPDIEADYVRVQDVKGIGHAHWYMGTNSVDVSGNNYLIWSNPPTTDFIGWGGPI